MKFRADRLLKVARALRESPRPRDFTMEKYGTACGTPACALGHYAARRDMQRTFLLGNGDGHRTWLVFEGESISPIDEPVTAHFGISATLASELFDPDGCNGATTPKDAARYIERFVKRQLKESRS